MLEIDIPIEPASGGESDDRREVGVAVHEIWFECTEPAGGKSRLCRCWSSNWNGKALLPRCLDALSRTAYPQGRWEAVLVDNASTDGSLESALVSYPWVVPWRNPANWGFARGYLAPMAASPGPYVVLLNSDTQVTPGWLRALVGARRRSPIGGRRRPSWSTPGTAPTRGASRTPGGCSCGTAAVATGARWSGMGGWSTSPDEGSTTARKRSSLRCALVLSADGALEDTGAASTPATSCTTRTSTSPGACAARLEGGLRPHRPGGARALPASSGSGRPSSASRWSATGPLMLLKLAPGAGRAGGGAPPGRARARWRPGLGWAITRRQRGATPRRPSASQRGAELAARPAGGAGRPPAYPPAAPCPGRADHALDDW